MQINPTVKVDPSQCPAELQSMYNNLINSKKNFIDTSFPPKNSTIGDEAKLDADMKNCIWLRPK
jgi:hypothetical protein